MDDEDESREDEDDGTRRGWASRGELDVGYIYTLFERSSIPTRSRSLPSILPLLLPPFSPLLLLPLSRSWIIPGGWLA